MEKAALASLHLVVETMFKYCSMQKIASSAYDVLMTLKTYSPGESINFLKNLRSLLVILAIIIAKI